MHKNDNSKVKQVVTMLNELGVKVKVSRSRFEIMNRIAHNEKLRLILCFSAIFMKIYAHDDSYSKHIRP